jgi:hypothetical protein
LNEAPGQKQRLLLQNVASNPLLVWDAEKAARPTAARYAREWNEMDTSAALKSIFYFILAGLCEIGGGYLVWLWLREDKSLWYGAVGAIVLVLYGVVPTMQPAHFGRVYAA